MRRRTALIVEDDVELRRIFRLALSFDGFHGVEASDGLEALHLIDEEPPDLIVLDLGLPGVSGHEVLSEVAAHAETRRIPVVVVTGASEDLNHLDVACVLQ